MTVKKEDGTVEFQYEFVPAVYCSEKYADWIAQNPDSDVAKKMSSSNGYVCPKTNDIVLYRNPFIADELSGSNFGLVVNDCAVAKNSISDSAWSESYAAKIDCLPSKQDRLNLVPGLQIEAMLLALTLDVQPNERHKKRLILGRVNTGLLTNVI
mmetsp:Transcript_34493/g.45373  ORF Transcript_34493/g.45373 Transcript_34493/m.45373 type:complete len:154 (+) Transcript_34493:372-833(+)|eukprot:CAMPEP_0185589536 /NCGR_PEP_ID=MMETSP0434-20130131/57423_1 /TAXON_ID=626734 ORGANISM="Favella taraikaensis, Strain Fe Narragansett Bay" /NCGR_SAMPLE_ID=MMETSP0434 /ASSEMBLY_ACC=CAM_ASM_000379 /LENGTH=153 /DNA_ID=CAMNT_0028212997 /DNA_START=254 /DNA_END=715 /DNA_ORIENTATION=+